MTDTRPTHIPAEGEGTPALPANSDLAPRRQDEAEPAPGDDDFVPAGTHPA
jgi:hypothetical protein